MKRRHVHTVTPWGWVPAYGYCYCGCGQPTQISKSNHRTRGYRKGEPMRFIRWHNRQQNIAPFMLDESTPLVNGQHCCRWQWAKHKNGYGMFSGTTNWRWAHRYIYEIQVGPIPRGMVLDHLCRVKDCINFNHLEVVTDAENVRRGVRIKFSRADIEFIRQSKQPRIDALTIGMRPKYANEVHSGRVWGSAGRPRRDRSRTAEGDGR